MKLLRNILILLVLGSACYFTGKVAWKIHLMRAWFAVQNRQLQLIHQLKEIPPQGWDQPEWAFSITILHNVWGNVLYHPESANATRQEMEELEHQLKQILTETTRENSDEQADRIYRLLLGRGRKIEFIRNYYDEFLSLRKTGGHTNRENKATMDR